MLTFKPCTLPVLRSAMPLFRKLPTLCTELSTGTIWMWRAEQEPAVCIRNDTIILRQIMNGYPAFTFPVGPDAGAMLDELLALVRSENIALRFFAMDEASLQSVLKDPRFSDTMWGYDRRWSDYLYSFDAFLSMNGGELRKLRYRVNRFARLYGEPDLRPLTTEDLPAAREMLASYDLEHPGKDRLEAAEERHSRELLSGFRELGLPAAGLWVNGRMVGFIIGEIIGQTLMIHVEKALLAFTDVYPAMFHAFVRYVDALGCEGLRLINWEDDSGDPGLREVKEQLYHPEFLVHKYQAHVHTPGARMPDPYPVLRGERTVLTPFRETDRDVYFRMNMDSVNNRYWGYDYEEDYTVPAHPTRDTFYDSAQFDMSVGDSINYAIRLTEDGPMIGETLLWNFTDAGSVELGIRLLPEYIGKGLSKAALPLIEYAERQLGCTVRMRCVNAEDNRRALRFGLSMGFEETGRDDAWICLNRFGGKGGKGHA